MIIFINHYFSVNIHGDNCGVENYKFGHLESKITIPASQDL